MRWIFWLSIGLLALALSACGPALSLPPAGAMPNLDGALAYAERQAHQGRLMAQSGLTDAPAWVQQLVLAADQFIVVRRALPDDPNGRTVIAGYPWFGDWGRDTMISLPGLPLVRGRDTRSARGCRTHPAGR